jgi:hypothetical protein
MVLERDKCYGAIVPRSAKSNNRQAPSGLEWRPLRRWSTPNALLLPVAEAMAQLVCSEDFSLVKACEDYRSASLKIPANGLDWRRRVASSPGSVSRGILGGSGKRRIVLCNESILCWRAAAGEKHSSESARSRRRWLRGSCLKQSSRSCRPQTM